MKNRIRLSWIWFIPGLFSCGAYEPWVNSRHAASNTAVLIAKMRLGFLVSGFEYSEVYGPLVQLSHLVGEARRRLYQARSASLRTPP